MDHRHRFAIPVTISGVDVDKRCRCGLTLSELVVSERSAGAPQYGVRQAGAVWYVPVSVIAREAIDETFEGFGRGDE